MRIKQTIVGLLAFALVLRAGAAHAALPCTATWLSPYTYQATQASPITVSGTVNMPLQVTCSGLHVNLKAIAGCADSLTANHTCPAGQPTDGPFTYNGPTNQLVNGTATFTIPINTTTLQNGFHDVGGQAIDAASGAQDGGTVSANGGDGDAVLNVQNGGPPPTPAPTPKPTATPSANCSEITTVGPSLGDNSGNSWSFNSSFQALENNTVFDGSGPNLTDMTFSGGAIYVFYPPTSTWYVSSPAGTGWNNGQTTGPPCATPTPTPLNGGNYLLNSGAYNFSTAPGVTVNSMQINAQ